MPDETVILPVKLSRSDREALHDIATEQKTNVSDLVRGLLLDYMNTKHRQFTGQVKQRGGDRRSEAVRAQKRAV